jgi:hypothetical protein
MDTIEKMDGRYNDFHEEASLILAEGYDQERLDAIVAHYGGYEKVIEGLRALTPSEDVAVRAKIIGEWLDKHPVAEEEKNIPVA